MQQPTKRWYDAHEKIAKLLEWLKDAPVRRREPVVAGVLEIISDHAPALLEKYLLDFPLDQKRRRWYDQDPYLWLMVNGLEHASMPLLAKVTVYMQKKTGLSDRPARGKTTERKNTMGRAGARRATKAGGKRQRRRAGRK